MSYWNHSQRMNPMQSFARIKLVLAMHRSVFYMQHARNRLRMFALSKFAFSPNVAVLV